MKLTLLLFGIAALAAPAAAQDEHWVTQSMDLYPSLSPDGTTLLFHSSRLGVPRLFVSDPQGRGVRVLPGDGQRITPVWSPDGTRIAFVGVIDNQLDIFVMTADGGDVQRLTRGPEADMHPHWSADGERIVFNSERTEPGGGSVSDIFSMKADGTDVRKHVDCRGTCTYPALSPDGQRLVFRREVERAGFDWDLSPSTTDSEIVVTDLDGGNERNVSRNAGFDGWPTWSPDGQWIAFASNRAGPAFVGQIYMVRPDGAGLRQITSGDWSHAQPSFTSDGRSIFVYRLKEGPDFQYGFISRIDLPAS